MTPRRLAVLTRADCELCHQLLGILEAYAAAGRIELDLAEFDAQPLAVRERHQWRIPVVFEGDAELMWGRIDASEVERVLGPPPAA